MAVQNTKPTTGTHGDNTVPVLKRSIKNPFLFGGTVVLLVITVVAFVFLPASGGIGDDQQAPSFGKYAGKPVSYVTGGYFAGQVQQINDYLRQQGLSDANFSLYAYQVWKTAFESTVLRVAVIDEAKSSGFHITQDALDRAVAENDAFKVDGKFSPQTYRATPMTRKMEIRETTAEDLYVKRFYSDIYTASPSKAETDFIAGMGANRRSIDYVAIPVNSIPDSELSTWASSRTELFGKVSVSRITMTSSEADIKKVLKQVQDKVLSFEDAAKSHSKDAWADKDGDPGVIFYHDYASWFEKQEDAKAISVIPVGELSPVYKIADKTWAFFRVNAALQPAVLEDPAVKAEVRNYIAANERGMMETWALDKGKEFSQIASAGFAPAAKKAGYSVKSSGLFPINFNSPSFTAYGQRIPLLEPLDLQKAPELQDAPQNEAFFKAVFSATEGQVAEPILLGDSVLVYTVKETSQGKPEDATMVAFSYPYFYQGTLDADIRARFLKNNPKFKDEFEATFAKFFTPKESSAN